MSAVGERAPDAVVEGPDGEPTRLANLWRDGPTVLVFLRHFG